MDCLNILIDNQQPHSNWNDV